MTDPFWSFHVGRWGRARVRLHLALLLFAAFQVVMAAFPVPGAPSGSGDGSSGVEAASGVGALVSDPRGGLTPTSAELAAAVAAARGPRATLAWLGLLALALIWHELGHAVAARRLGLTQDEIQLWPLGNLARPPASSTARADAHLAMALAGPLASLIAVVVVGCAFAFACPTWSPVWNPFGGPAGGAPLRDGLPAPAFTLPWTLGWFWYLNWTLFLANLIPASPLDGGRGLHAVLTSPRVGLARDSLVEPWTARTCAAVLLIVGLVRLVALATGETSASAAGAPSLAGPLLLIGLAGMIEWIARTESRMVDDDGFFEDGVFEYDFSEGYTSLESSSGGAGAALAPGVGGRGGGSGSGADPEYRSRTNAGLRASRPRRESDSGEGEAAPWRVRWAEARRRKREARKAADLERLDALLEKIHREGRASLGEADQRFLTRVSERIREERRTRGSTGGGGSGSDRKSSRDGDSGFDGDEGRGF